MHLHEYQSKHLLGRYGVSVPMGQVAASRTEAGEAARRLGCKRFVVKAQAPVADRLRQDAVAFATTPEQVADQAGRLLDRRLSAGGNGAPEVPVRQVYVEERIEAAREIYAAVTIDRSSGRIVLLAAGQGGADIERRAQSDPDLIERLPLRLAANRAEGDFKALAARITDKPAVAEALADLYRNIAAAFVAYDATLLEINPLAVTHDGRLIALDAKITVDDNALFRRPDLAALRAENERAISDPHELEAQRYQINFIRLDGDIGVVVNGAGLALATTDLLAEAGGRPANFMDIRTTATSLDIAYGFGLLLDNPATRAILVNVHGGGMQRCDTIAEGIGIALRRSRGRKPALIIRMAGNNADFARTVLANNGVDYVEATDMAEAARLAVELSRKEAA